MVSQYAVVCDGQVVNVVLWDGQTDWTPDDGCTVYKLPDDSPVGPGWGRAKNGRYTTPAVVDPEPTGAPVTVDPAALAAFVAAVADPDVDTRQALADFASALNTEA